MPLEKERGERMEAFLCQKDHGNHRYHQDQSAKYPPCRVWIATHPSFQANYRRPHRCQTTDQGDQHCDEAPDKAAQALNRCQRDDEKENRHRRRKYDVICNPLHLSLSC